jgi:hypothetical protein
MLRYALYEFEGSRTVIWIQYQINLFHAFCTDLLCYQILTI